MAFVNSSINLLNIEVCKMLLKRRKWLYLELSYGHFVAMFQVGERGTPLLLCF